MGSPDSDLEACDDEKPRHKVRISEAFYLGVTPVTQDQYEAVMGKNPSHFKGPSDLPVESVTWYDAVAFCNKLSRMERLTPYYLIRGSKHVQIGGGSGYRLPTEAEWEYACRAGTERPYSFGDDAALLDRFGWYATNSRDRTHPVGRKVPNAFGLFDMHGNVWEWCWDGYDRFYYRQSPDVDPLGMEGATYRVIRGGGWNDLASDVRSASRHTLSPGFGLNFLSFMVGRVPKIEQAARLLKEFRFNFLGFRVARGLHSR
jgi:formylglycine-generating enzyme required for sulfatase activity